MSPHKFPPGLPPIKGIIAQLRFMSELSRDFMGFLVEKNRQYGDIFQFQVGDFRQYVITDPDLIHEVLVAQSAKFQKDMQYTDTRRGQASSIAVQRAERLRVHLWLHRQPDY